MTFVQLGVGKPEASPATAARCLFVNPSVPYGQWDCYRAGVMNEASFSSHGMAYVSATLKAAGHACWLVDLRSIKGWRHAREVLKAQEYDVAFVGFLSIDAFNAAAVVRLLKELYPDRPVVAGGLHVSIAKERVFPRDDLIEHYVFGNEDILPGPFREFLALKGETRYDPTRFPKADYVILDDGEVAARALVAELAAGRWPEGRTIDGGAVPMEVARHMDRDLFNLDFEAHSPILPFQPTPMVTVTWARGCPFHCTYSLTGDTVVFTDDGPVELAELASGIGALRNCVHGETVVDYRLDRSVAVPNGRKIATRVLAEGVRSVLRVTAEGGLSVKATPEHLFLSVAGETLSWKRTDALTTNDFLAVRAPEREWPVAYPALEPPVLSPRSEAHARQHRVPIILDEHLAWLAGFIVGDGCLSSSNDAVVRFCVFPHLVAKQRAIVRELFDLDLHIYPHKHTTKAFQGQIHSRRAREVLVQSLGMDRGDKLKIPSIFWHAPKTVLAAFVDGLFEADAYDGGDHEYLTTVSRRLAHDVGYALLMLGRGCPHIYEVETKVECSKDGRDFRRQPSHYRVGVLYGDRIPSTRSVYRSAKSGLWHWRTRGGANRVGVRRRTLRESGLHHPLDRDGWYYVQVRSIEECLAEPVYDLTVPDGESFVANGFVAHNCNLSSQLSNTNVRQKPVELVEEELDDLHRRFGGRVGSLMIHDDLTFHSKHVTSWCELILRKYGPIPIWMQTRADWIITRYKKDREFWELLCRAGLVWVSVGYESGSNRVLEYMKKDSTVEKNREAGRVLDEYGINSFGNFLWGVPTETNEEAEATVKLVEEIKPGFLSGSIYCSFPGTAQDRACREGGLLVEGQVYCRSHLPWQYTIKGIDYAHRYECVSRAGRYANYLRMPRLLSEDRQRDLAACARGLPIHAAGEASAA